MPVEFTRNDPGKNTKYATKCLCELWSQWEWINSWIDPPLVFTKENYIRYSNIERISMLFTFVLFLLFMYNFLSPIDISR